MASSSKNAQPPELEILGNGISYKGWTSISIDQSLRSIAGSFEVSMTDSWDETKKSWFLGPGTSVKVQFGDQPMITGFVDKLETSVSGQNRTITISGRDKTSDLVDCSIVSNYSTWINYDLFKIAQIWCKPFKISVINNANVGIPFPGIVIDVGETVFGALEKYSKIRGILLMTDGKGNLILANPKTNALSKCDLVEGSNIKSCSIDYDFSHRFSDYTIRGQIPNTDDAYGGTQIYGKAKDAGSRQNRPLIIHSETNMTFGIAGQRAQWEAAYRAANSAKVTVEVLGWQQGGNPNDPLWSPKLLTNVIAPSLHINNQLLISDVRFNLSDDSGQTTTLTLQRADAFIPEPTTPEIEDPVFFTTETEQAAEL